MRWVLAALVVAWSVVASAQTMTIPPGFAKTAGGDVYKALAAKGETIAVQVYRDGDAELATIAWQWKSEAPTRSGVAIFERDLARRAMPGGAHEVSNTVMFDQDPMLTEVFDTVGAQRVYHRRLYAVDAKNMVHIWWTICTAPATTIGECERAQRTMKLDVAHAVTLPALPPPAAKPSAGAFPVPASYPDADRPGTIDVPAGYHELTIAKLDELLDNIQSVMVGRMSGAVGRVFAPADDSVRLLEISFRVSIDQDAPRELVRELETGISSSDPILHVLGDNLASEQSDPKLERHTLYGADRSYVYAFSVSCIGPVAARAACVRALVTMRLAVPDQVAPTDPSWDRDRHRSALGQLMFLVLVVVVPLAALIWIAKNRNQRRRRRRTITIDPS